MAGVAMQVSAQAARGLLALRPQGNTAGLFMEKGIDGAIWLVCIDIEN
jgi:hypothetical protein